MKIFTDWLVNGETSLSKLKTPSKLVEPIEKQIKAHKVHQFAVWLVGYRMSASCVVSA